MRNRFRAGDTTALGEAYDEHAQVLFRYAMRVCGDQAAAEDVVSATFLEAWRCRERLRPDGDGLRPWLLGIATNILRSTAREARRRDTALARLADRGVLPDFADDVVTRLYDTEQLTAARAALKRLRRRDREVFALVVWAGLDYAAAGEALGIPTGTVRSRLSRARDRLRALADAELKAVRKARKARRGDGAGGTGARTTPGEVRSGGTGLGDTRSGGSEYAEPGSSRAVPAGPCPVGGMAPQSGSVRAVPGDVRSGGSEYAEPGSARAVPGEVPSGCGMAPQSGSARTALADARSGGSAAPQPASARTVLADPRPARPAHAVATTAPAAAHPIAVTVPVPDRSSLPAPAPALARRPAPENSL
ncbi:sigma-70 family RNA polymerase sigma factor [Streptomyces sp. NPDC093111]|uniref:sigma-70 family RNA polymerase sigma factor n=1 Tax=Streptomyces sp. NPDC093111 TaxID=3154978 RepID=UPI003437954D